MVFISRIHEVKNLKYAMTVASKKKTMKLFLMYMDQRNHPEYWNECERIGQDAPANVKLNYCGTLSPDEVGKTFKKYDCFYFQHLMKITDM